MLDDSQTFFTGFYTTPHSLRSDFKKLPTQFIRLDFSVYAD